MGLHGRAPGCCPLEKVMPCTLSSGQATFPSPSSMKAPRAGRTLSLPTPSPGRSASKPRLLQQLPRDPSHPCGVWRKPASQINRVHQWQLLQRPSLQLPMDPSGPSLQRPRTAPRPPPQPACLPPPAGAAWVVISSPGATFPSL